MSTAHKTKEEVQEHFDDPEVVQARAVELADKIKNSRHFVIFTGAGISTAAGIPDFRGPNGVWTLRAQGKTVERKHNANPRPTFSHLAIVELFRHGYLKHLISQNCDGLHMKSGIPPENLSELHGNKYLEKCRKKGCGREYLRSFRTRNAKKVHDHRTGRKCDACGTELQDSIINFGENLPGKPLRNGEANSKNADLHLCLGSSLRVTPAADLPVMTVENKGELWICNLQKTPLDKLGVAVHSKIDEFMKMVMDRLGIEVPNIEDVPEWSPDMPYIVTPLR